MTPDMPAEHIAALEERLRGSQTYLEFGSGGSTVLAARLNVPNIVSVDSSTDWIGRVKEEIGSLATSSRVHLLHANIGETKDYGHPKDNSMLQNWPSYSTGAWAMVRAAGLQPDTVLVDGRFRVACFLASLIYLQPGAVILWDDYRGRDSYYVVESIVKPTRFHGYMAEFSRVDQLDNRVLLEMLIKYLFVQD